MAESFGPWATAMHAGPDPQLSTFWKRRLTLLGAARRSRPALSRRAVGWLVVLGLLACALPAVQWAPVLGQPAEKQAPADAKPPGRIFVNVTVRENDNRSSHIIAIDPATGTWKKITGRGHHVRVSPDGQTLVFGGMDKELWNCDARAGTAPGRIFDRASLASWSPDGKHLIVCGGTSDDNKKPVWTHQTWRLRADGTEVTELPIPSSDEVDDWSPDGKWLVTVSDRHPPHGRGYQLYVMRPDGKDERRLTQTGLNCYPRFSPDSRRLVYTHQERGGNSLWVVDIDGKNARKLLEEEGLTSPEAACWSPDGKRLAVVLFDWQQGADGKKFLGGGDANFRIELMDADGRNRRELKLAGEAKVEWIGHPDWR